MTFTVFSFAGVGFVPCEMFSNHKSYGLSISINNEQYYNNKMMQYFTVFTSDYHDHNNQNLVHCAMFNRQESNYMHGIVERTEVIPCRIIAEHIACTVQRGHKVDGWRLSGEGPEAHR
jgi:hypothetical protein